MKSIEVSIAKSFIYNILYSVILSFISVLAILSTIEYYIEDNPLSQFGPIYKSESVGAWFELPHDYSLDTSTLLLIRLKIVFTFQYNIEIFYTIFSFYFIMIYAIKYLRIKIK